MQAVRQGAVRIHKRRRMIKDTGTNGAILRTSVTYFVCTGIFVFKPGWGVGYVLE